MPGKFYVSVKALIERDGKVLLVKRAQCETYMPDVWETVGGRINQGETAEAGLLREVKEEVGIEISIVRPHWTFFLYRPDEKEEVIGVSFICKYLAGEVTLNPDEHSDFMWMSPVNYRTFVHPSCTNLLSEFAHYVRGLRLQLEWP